MTYKTYKFVAEANMKKQVHEHFDLQVARSHAINLKVWGYTIKWLREGLFTEAES